MSTSVILEGSIIKEDAKTVWKGTWRFAKDKKGLLSFYYEKVSNEVPADLLDYVSFLDPQSIAQSLHSKPESSNSKSRRGRRGRPGSSHRRARHSLPPSAASAQSTANAEQGAQEGEKREEGEREGEGEGEGEDGDENGEGDGEEGEEEEEEEDNEKGEGEGEKRDQSAPHPPTEAPLPAPQPLAPLPEQKREAVALSPSHPLLGLWQGYFKVLGPRGEEAIEETLFFHAFLGADVPPALLCLPPEPSFPYSLLKQQQIQSSLSESDPTSMLELLYKQVLVGFGRNPLGRFSVAALDGGEGGQGELRGEKKYMTTKYSVKRGRRSHAEYALNYGIHPSAQIQPNVISTRSEGAEEGGQGVRQPRTAYPNNYYLTYEEGGERKRKRSASIVKPPLPQHSPQELSLLLAEHPTALIGERNPDQDDPTVPFKEAFQDLETGEIYEGGWVGGLKHGVGVCLQSDGLLYEGQWSRGREHGKGVLMTGDRQVIYTGDWADGTMHGQGTYYYGNGDVYVGDFREGNRHGRGEYLLFANNCRYIGDWRENKRHGRGKFIWGDGVSYYEGEWEGDMRSGRGVLELSDGFRYEGHWASNVMEGKGTCTYGAGGQVYQGTFKGGLRDGRGSIIFPNNDAVYEGRFKEDRFEGQGTVKINHTMQGAEEDEIFIPLQIQSDFWRIHWKAGFGSNAH